MSLAHLLAGLHPPRPGRTLLSHFEPTLTYHMAQVFIVRSRVHFTLPNFLSSPLFQPSRPFRYRCFPLHLSHQQISSAAFHPFVFLLWSLMKTLNNVGFPVDLEGNGSSPLAVTCPCPVSFFHLKFPPCPTSSLSRQMQSPTFPLSKKSIILLKSASINLCFTFAPLSYHFPFTSVTATVPCLIHFLK